MLAINFQSTLSKTNFQTNPRVMFCRYNKALVNGDCFVKSKSENNIEEQKELLNKTLSNKKAFKNPNLKDSASKILDYSKTSEQLELAEFVFNEEFFHTEQKMSKIKGVICASMDKKKSDFVKKVFTNENVYKNENVLNKLETVLYSMDNSTTSCEAKNIVIDKILSTNKLNENKSFMDNVGVILYNTSDKIQAYKVINVADSILNNEELSQDDSFLFNVGKVLATNKISDDIVENNIQTSILKSIQAIKSPESTDLFVKVMNNKKLVSNNEFMQYLPDIIDNTNHKTIDKTVPIVAYINKNKTKNVESFNREVISEYMSEDFSSVASAEQYVRVKFKAYEKKSQLQNADITLTDKNIDKLFEDNKKNIIPALEILGEKNFVHSYKFKSQGAKDLWECCSLIKRNITDEDYEKLLEKINPQASQKYINSQEKLNDLKKNYLKTKKLDNQVALKTLQNEINTQTKYSQDILANKLEYDPETTINKIMVVSNVITTIKDNDKAQQECHKFIDLMQNSTPNNDEKWQKAVCKSVFEKLDVPYNSELVNKLGISNNKYLGKILSANDECVTGIKKTFKQITKYPNKSVGYALNQLENNKDTKKLFDAQGIDYNKWVGYDESSYVPVGNGNVIVRKANMNDVSKGLFLGNEVGCCTAVGSRHYQESAPTYVLNKFVGAIEVVDSDIPVGNTMCYFANVKGKLAFVMDNIHMHSAYKNNENIKAGIVEYAQKLCEEVGKPDIPIYISGHRNSVDLSEFDSDNCLISIIGDSGNDKVYLDSITSCTLIKPDKYYNSELTRVI